MPSCNRPLPVIDLFAGPGGLGEGFATCRDSAGEPAFEVRLSIEKDHAAHQTLTLRSFVHAFARRRLPEAYYDLLRRHITLDELFARHPKQAEAAQRRACLATLGPDSAKDVRQRITEALGTDKDRRWVLIGGPPCQAYSLAGRSRNRGIADYDAEKDARQTLYLEYLQVLAVHGPAAFVMENVKGLSSATLNGRRIISRIIEDLHDPAAALRREDRSVSRIRPRYELHSLSDEVGIGLLGEYSGSDFVLRSERYGVPQARHRVIIVGVRSDITDSPRPLSYRPTRCVTDAIKNLPHIRSQVSRGSEKDVESWTAVLRNMVGSAWWNQADAEMQSVMSDHLDQIGEGLISTDDPWGDEFVEYRQRSKKRDGRIWIDPRLDGLCNHRARSHMPSDLHRYFFASCYAKLHGRSPSLVDFPRALLPAHQNAIKALGGSYFADRFRVQCWDRPSTTVVSHIAKDGHYYIHPDPTQCRSLTVREAARLQTFPDNYLFMGNRTQQYTQVGNAVPPYLAKQIAERIVDVLA